MFYRNIGHIQHSAPITVDVESGKLYVHRCLLCVFASEAKVKDGFEGNLVDFGRASDSSSSILHLTKNILSSILSILLPTSLPCSSLWMQLQVSRGDRFRMSIGSSRICVYTSGGEKGDAFLAKGESGALVPTLERTKVARPATILLAVHLAVEPWIRPGSGSSTPTTTEQLGKCDNNVLGLLPLPPCTTCCAQPLDCLRSFFYLTA